MPYVNVTKRTATNQNYNVIHAMSLCNAHKNSVSGFFFFFIGCFIKMGVLCLIDTVYHFHFDRHQGFGVFTFDVDILSISHFDEINLYNKYRKLAPAQQKCNIIHILYYTHRFRRLSFSERTTTTTTKILNLCAHVCLFQ